MSGRIDFEGIAARNPLHEVAGRVMTLRRAGREWTGCCPFHAENTPSFTIYESAGRERYKCFGCGAGGDVFQFVASFYGVSLAEAAKMLGGDHSVSAARRAPPAPRKDEGQKAIRALEKLKTIYKTAQGAEGSPVEAYLRGRGIDLDRLGGVPASLRYAYLAYYHPRGDGGVDNLGTHPAMIAPIQQCTGAMQGLHVTYLRKFAGGVVQKLRLDDPARPGKFLTAKKVRGSQRGGCVRLGPAAEFIKIAEGIETALSVAAALKGTEADSPVWTFVSLGNLAVCGLPDTVKRVLVLADNDMKPAKGSQRDTRVWLREQAGMLARGGKEVRITWPPVGMDFNDLYARGARGGEA